MLRICAAFVLALLPICAFAGPSGAVRVIDADTWDVGGQRVRLFGIDAPELSQTCTNATGGDWPCGRWASEQVRVQYNGRNADCDQITIDRYQRIVAVCNVGGQDVARLMVQTGLAFAYRKYAMDYDLDEKRAVVDAIGLHAGQVERPAEFRAQKARVTTPPPKIGCDIKGNISASGTQIYHVPGQDHYSRTRISERKGERWFCSEAQAKAAGWRRARR
ncbi:MAG: thermonuclease family protein [Sedimentitalea sp.]